MADGVKMTVRKDALFQRLRQLVPATDAAVTLASQQSADEMVALARSFAPSGATGDLRGSIRSEPNGTGSFIVRAGGEATTREARGGSGAPFDYALGVEFGTSAHDNEGLFKGSHNPGARRQPFFWPAYRLVKKRHKGRVSRALTKAIKNVMGK